MGDDENVIKQGPLKGKKVKLAGQKKVEENQKIADDFMLQIFGMPPAKYLITDESAIGDFCGVKGLDTVESINQKIEEIYGIVPASVYLAKIFEQIKRKNATSARTT